MTSLEKKYKDLENAITVFEQHLNKVLRAHAPIEEKTFEVKQDTIE